MGPIDYSGAFAPQAQNPFAGALQAIQLGATIRDDRAQQAALALKQKQAAEMNAALLDASKDPTPQRISALSVRYPQLSEGLKRSYDMQSAEAQKSNLSAMTQVYAAVNSDRPEIGAQLLRQQAAAQKESGRDKEAQASETMAKLIEASPQHAKLTIGTALAGILGPDKFGETFAKLGGEARAHDLAPNELAKAKAEAAKIGAEAKTATTTADFAARQAEADLAAKGWHVKNIQSEIGDRSKRFGLERDRLQTETQLKLTELQQKFGELPEYVAKDINTATTDAISADQAAAKMRDLASKLQAEGGGYGAASGAAEWLKKATGNQNEMTRLRAEYSRIVTPAAMAAYKKVASGSTSDKDIETAMTGVPGANADSNELASFLRGVAKLQTYDSVANNAKAEWLGSVRSLNKASKDIEIDGVKVPAGTTFKQFSDNYVAAKAGKLISSQVIDELSKKYPAAPPANTGGASGNY